MSQTSRTRDSKWSHQRLYGSTEDASVDSKNHGGQRWELNKKKHWVVVGIAMILLVISLAIGFAVSASNQDGVAFNPATTMATNVPSKAGDSHRESILGNYTHAAVASDGGSSICANIGRKVMEENNGTAVDAAIATLFCNGLVSSHSMGIGGGFLMTVYEKRTGKVTTINAREMAPAAATEDMYHGNADLSSEGALAVAVPGEIMGYKKAKELFGNPEVSWESLIQPSIELARQGIPVTFSKASALEGSKEAILRDPGMREIYINPDTNDTWKEGDTYRRPNFADTLQRIASLGFQEFYRGKTAKNFVKDLQQLGGIITLQDLKDYRVKVEEAIKVDLGGLTLYSVPPPGSGIILAFILNIMENYNVTAKERNDPLLYHRIVESFKYAYAYRSQIGDPADMKITDTVEKIVAQLTSEKVAYDTFRKINDSATVNDPKYYGGDFQYKDDSGTSHTSVLAPNGDAVAVTSTVNLHFGAKIMSPSTGIIYNDEMDDFSSPNITNEFNLPPSPHNFIRPGKRPQSSMCPAILVDDSTGSVRVVAGAAGGTKITTATAFSVLHNLWLGENIKGSIDARRIHHQLLPMRVDYEEGFSKGLLDGLASRGHSLNQLGSAGSVVSGITRENDGRIYANSDFRKAGGVDGF